MIYNKYFKKNNKKNNKQTNKKIKNNKMIIRFKKLNKMMMNI